MLKSLHDLMNLVLNSVATSVKVSRTSSLWNIALGPRVCNKHPVMDCSNIEERRSQLHCYDNPKSSSLKSGLRLFVKKNDLKRFGRRMNFYLSFYISDYQFSRTALQATKQGQIFFKS